MTSPSQPVVRVRLAAIAFHGPDFERVCGAPVIGYGDVAEYRDLPGQALDSGQAFLLGQRPLARRGGRRRCAWRRQHERGIQDGVTWTGDQQLRE